MRLRAARALARIALVPSFKLASVRSNGITVGSRRSSTSNQRCFSSIHERTFAHTFRLFLLGSDRDEVRIHHPRMEPRGPVSP
jgi:hypothetical protein